ncbi:MAG: hypothetical protein KGY74_10220 [Candidatus Cloacimonetes bacterium]|nr:hypothetical protein [Candidatus Cloacimonadota bacterium]
MKIKKAKIEAIFESEFNENGITVYFKLDDIADDRQQAVKIKNLYRNPVNERFGTIGITGFRGEWNADWEKGKVVKFGIVSKESKGKHYLNLRCPEPKRSSGGSINLDPIINKLEYIAKLAEDNSKLLGKIFEELDSMEEPEEDPFLDGEPDTSSEETDEDIPF